MTVIESAARIGPNVLIQTARTLELRFGRERAAHMVALSTPHTIDALPTDMVDERTANALMREVVDRCGPTLARSVMYEAGTRTGDYLLAHRIPSPVRLLLPRLPSALALRVLLAAIGRHTWTFAGSAHVRCTTGDPAVISLSHCPLCAGLVSRVPLCDFYTGTFAQLAKVLLGPDAFAEEVSCEAQGGSSCRFLIGTRTPGMRSAQRIAEPSTKSYIVTRRSR